MQKVITQEQDRSKTINNGPALLDHIRQRKNLKNDAGVCRLLNITAPVISRIRNRAAIASDAFILRVHENTGMPVKEIRAILEA